MAMKINEIKAILAENPTEAQLEEFKADARAGVQKLVQSYYKRLEKEAEEKQRFYKMMEFERKFTAEGAEYICGVDEAGRGPLAGPLVIASVILPKDVFISGLNDSKQISAVKRDKLYDEVVAKAIAISVNIVSISNIDTKNIYRATQEGMAEVISHLAIKPQVALVDAMPVHVEGVKSVAIVHGDALSASIAAASIIAKVTRDRIMEDLDKLYPVYGFAGHKGYGSALHMQAIREHGASIWHRRSYEPIKSMNLAPVEEEQNILYSPLTDNFHYQLK
ncbi:MAG: ribonuclease HII [Phascolarctobacterium sp.]|nr:ribonuclease HII [Phascolarctobacterium sp.]